MTSRHYSKAPIIEAVVDIQVSLPSDFSNNSLLELAKKLADKFPISNNITSFQLAVQADVNEVSTPQVSSSQSDIGLRLSDNENSRILQLRNFGLAYSHLPPYSNWDVFSGEAKEYWSLFLDYCKPEMVTRCAVRYINRIDIPEQTVEIEQFLTIYPQIPDNIPQVIAGMQMHLEMPQDDLGLAVINQAVVEPAISDGFSVMVDIDLFKMVSLKPQSDDVWDLLEKLRVRKNELFEAFITDKTRELIQ